MAKEVTDALYQEAIQELAGDDLEAGEKPLTEGDHERVRAFILAGYRPGMNAEQRVALREDAVRDLLWALQSAPDTSLAELAREVHALGEVVARIVAARGPLTGVEKKGR